MSARHFKHQHFLWVRSPLIIWSTRLFASVTSRPVNHYEVLGVSPKANQKEIKAAYYELSKRYHPDVNTESADSFRKITAAYEVLGNLKQRKLYDRGLLPHDGTSWSPSDAQDPDLQTKRGQHVKYRRTGSQPATGKTAIYDFDEWTRFHYGQAIHQRKMAKEKQKTSEQREESMKGERQSEYMVFGTIMSCFLLMSFGFVGNKDHDKPSANNKVKSVGS